MIVFWYVIATIWFVAGGFWFFGTAPISDTLGLRVGAYAIGLVNWAIAVGYVLLGAGVVH